MNHISQKEKQRLVTWTRLACAGRERAPRRRPPPRPAPSSCSQALAPLHSTHQGTHRRPGNGSILTCPHRAVDRPVWAIGPEAYQEKTGKESILAVLSLGAGSSKRAMPDSVRAASQRLPFGTTHHQEGHCKEK